MPTRLSFQALGLLRRRRVRRYFLALAPRDAAQLRVLFCFTRLAEAINPRTVSAETGEEERGKAQKPKLQVAGLLEGAKGADAHLKEAIAQSRQISLSSSACSLGDCTRRARSRRALTSWRRPLTSPAWLIGQKNPDTWGTKEAELAAPAFGVRARRAPRGGRGPRPRWPRCRR
jgi:hypothetical protein